MSQEFAEDSVWQKQLLLGSQFLDVRAPIEFQSGHAPGAKNIAILTDSERHQIGLTYKQQGNEAAVKLGYELVSGVNKETKLHAWIDWAKSQDRPILYCARGGQRSQISQQWLKEAGLEVPRIAGGYKTLRHFFLQQIETKTFEKQLFIISGNTGSGKSHLIEAMPSGHYINLERLANHKGSSFGAELSPQPAQAQFENDLALELINSQKKLYLEDESKTIGHIALPPVLFQRMLEAPLLVLDLSVMERAKNIFKDYVIDLFFRTQKDLAQTPEQAWGSLLARHQQSLKMISKKLGGLKAQEISNLLTQAFALGMNPIVEEAHLSWIEQLLIHYYDPFYEAHLARHQHRVLKRGSHDDMRQFIANDFSSQND